MVNIHDMRLVQRNKLYAVGATNPTYFDTLTPTLDYEGGYYYPDLNYADKSRAVWNPAKHLARIQAELALGGEKKLKSDAAWREKLLGAYNYWLVKDFTSDNWWYNQISTPKSLLNIALMTDEYLTDEMKNTVETLALRGSFKAHLCLGMTTYPGLPKHNATPDVWRAANLMWGATTTVFHALWTEDEELMKIAVSRIEDELCYSETGIQEDGAFIQHGRRWYSAGYGIAFVNEITPLIHLLGGTEFAISKEKINILLTHVLDGQRHMHRNGHFDFGARGRDYSRKSGTNPGIFAKSIKMLSETEGIARREELAAFYNEITGGPDLFEATTFYPSIAQLCHKKDGIYLSARGRTNEVLGAEHCNQEGVLSYNMSYGTVTCVLESGLEYANISPIWNYSKIPGTTARVENDEEILAHEGWAHTVETECRTSGYTDGPFGILTEHAAHDGISLEASFFTFGGAMAVLGTDIRDEKGETLYTTVEQCLPSNTEIKKNLVRNGNVFYKNLGSDADFISLVEKRVGSWHRNNFSSSEAPTYGDVLTITIPVTTGSRYAYLIYNKKEPKVEVLRNDAECQAILVENSKLMAVFRNNAEITVKKTTISAKAGELVIRDL